MHGKSLHLLFQKIGNLGKIKNCTISQAAVFTHSFWDHTNKYNIEHHYIRVKVKTRKRIKRVKQVENIPKPLGWSGKYYLDEQVGSAFNTYVWSVRVSDFDQIRGGLKSKIDKVSYVFD